MVFVRFIFYYIYTFYKKRLTSDDPELYAYFAVVILILMNSLSVIFAYSLIMNTSGEIGVVSGIGLGIIALAIPYFSVVKSKSYSSLDESDFLIKNTMAWLVVVVYIVLTFLITLYLAHEGRVRA